MLENQALRIRNSMTKRGVLESQLGRYASNIANAHRLTQEDVKSNWVRLDTVLSNDEEIFLAVERSLDFTIGLDSIGGLYVPKDYGLQLLGANCHALRRERDVARNWVWILAGFLVLLIVQRLFGF
jgi:hypothetical protein